MDDREIPVPLILARHRHDGARAVTHQNVVRNIQRDRLSGKSIKQIGAGKNTPFFQCATKRQPLGFTHILRLLHKGPDSFRLVLRRNFGNQRMFGRQYGVSHSERGVRPCGKHRHTPAQWVRLALCIAHLHFEFSALGTADPVPLLGCNRVRPAFQLVQALEQFLAVISDFQEPLGY